MNIRLVLQLLGKVLLVGALLMLPAFVVACLYREGDIGSIGLGATITFAVGACLTALSRPEHTALRARDGFAVVALSWIMLGLCGALPLYFTGEFGSYTNCVFECVSGFTTTGATILPEIESLPHGILFWRSFTHWIGGMGILVLTIALIPQMGSRALHLLRAESTGPSPDKLVPRIAKSAKTLYTLYLALSLLEVIVLLFCGMNLYDALMHMFSTAGTGGFSNYNLSAGSFNSAAVDIALSVFMLLFSLNFTIYFRMAQKEWFAPVRNCETRVFFGIVLFSTVAIALNILPRYGSFSTSLRHSFFQVSSIISTTGFSTQNFDLWPQFSKVMLIALMLIGGCAGSTAGGIKVMRLVVLAKGMRRELRRTIHPRSVSIIRVDGRAVDEDMFGSVCLFFFVYMAVALVAMAILALDSHSFETTTTAVIACLTNTGPGLGAVGPLGNFDLFSPLSKWTLTLCMLIGRLDIYPILMFFSAAAWKKL